MKINYSSEEEKKNKIYKTWRNMIQRCTNPNCKLYQWYGGRGIFVCYRWMIFDNFYDDMESTWTKERNTIDRIDNDRNYEPENCQWLSRSENSSKMNNERVKNKTHPFTGGEIQRRVQQKRIDDGTHNFIEKRNPSHKRIKEKTHNFLDGELSRKVQQDRINNGTHHFLLGINKGKLYINNGIIEKKVHPEEFQKFIDEGWTKGKIPKIKKECPHCQKEFDQLNYSRWHGNKCKQNQKVNN